jgi:trehalose 6-phosphate synthase
VCHDSSHGEPALESIDTEAPTDLARPKRGGRLVVLSNRVALPGLVQPGGVASALGDALRESGGVWIGWSGKRSDDREPRRTRNDNIEYITLDLDSEEHRGFYLDYANRTLWPLLHSRADLLEHDPKAQAVYHQVNRRFAEVLARVVEPGDVVWIHDYHFLPMAAKLRAHGVLNPLGMFLHTPFPSPDIAQALPRHRDVFGALAEFDLVGVQTRRDLDHLRRYLQRDCPTPAALPELRVFPIGINPEVMRAHAETAALSTGYQQLRQSLLDRQLVVGVDRLDYSKGLPNRFQAYRMLFKQHPDLLRRVSYLQIAPISRGEVHEYKKLKSRLDSLSGSINSRYGDADWVPLRYVARGFKQSVLAGFYRAARVGFVTPLRDGMNLVAKEFVAAQDPHDPGVLILSEFAGAAEQMQAALLVNPYDISDMADVLAVALRMPLAERRQRWERLIKGVQDDDVSSWWRGFVECLTGLARRPAQLTAAAPANPSAPGFRDRRAVPRSSAASTAKARG